MLGKRIIDYIEYWAHKNPKHIALIYEEERITYKMLYDNAYKYASILLNMGISSGNRIAYVIDCCPQFFYLYLGSSIIGSSLAGINTRSPLNEIKRLAQIINAKLIICDQERIDEVAQLGLNYQNISSIDENRMSYNNLSICDRLRDQIEDDTPVFTVFTSGTTGVPKGAILTQNNIITSVEEQVKEFGAPSGLSEYDVIQHHVPICHVSGAVQWGVAPLIAGCTMILHRHFNAEKVLKNTEKYSATILTGVPSMWELMFRDPSFDTVNLSSVRWCATGAAPTTRSLAEKIFEICNNVSNPFGMTETSGFCSRFEGKSTLDTVLNTIGTIIPKMEYLIVDNNGIQLDKGEVGQLAFKGDSIINCYINAEMSRNKEGYFITGDLAFEDESQRIHLCGRKDNMFSVGAHNVYPEEIEKLIIQYPNVKKAVVFPVEHHSMGYVCKAVIVPDEKSCSININSLIHFLENNLVYYKIPRDIMIADDLPANALGKINRKKCQELFR